LVRCRGTVCQLGTYLLVETIFRAGPPLEPIQKGAGSGRGAGVGRVVLAQDV
jgi:hypothetical protein